MVSIVAMYHALDGEHFRITGGFTIGAKEYAGVTQ